MTTLDTLLRDVIGGRSATPLEKAFGMRTVRDLLQHYPRRLAERGELTDLATLQVDEDVTVLAEVQRSDLKGFGKAERVEVLVGDGTGTLQLVFFGRKNRFRQTQLVVGARGLFAGKVGVFNGKRQLTHPDFILLGGSDADDKLIEEYAGAIIPVYPTAKNIRTWQISNAVSMVFKQLDPIPDPVPAEVRARHGLMDLDSALHVVHRPETQRDWYAAKRRLAWDEAFGIQLTLAQRRVAARANPAVARPAKAGGLLSAFDERLPFRLTAGQVEVGDVIAGELAAVHPMQRLLQGEVGSGKTVVALRAMLQVVDAGGQAALLAPTEVLAQQHARSIEAMLGPLAQAGLLGGSDDATRVVLLTGSMSTAARKTALLEAAVGTAGIVIGTHALIQAQVGFHDLGLVVVDEQHRFGVEQRDALRYKSDAPPHLLVMTATPIPRTVAMTVFGDLEVSTLRELPGGRAPISTVVVPTAEHPAWLDRVWQRIREEVGEGRQAFIVCPRIGDGDGDTDSEVELDDATLDGAGTAVRPPIGVVETFEQLRSGPLADVRIAALHGRLPSDEKDRVMLDFAAGRIDVLVATTVIEVGVDVPNATVMAVLDADRFGVSQLHQLRGRVGRGGAAGTCLLVTAAPQGAPARVRLDAVAATTDGFALARLDVEQRREGDILGVAQSGTRKQLKLLSLLKDEDLIVAARAEATDLVAADPELDAHPLLAAQVAALIADERSEFLEKA
jgi:ATP-dependent DNA helicase RecG